ncbi:MAG TPA: tRNA (adenosine(37)-N6)-dimethylallyltransferase MiaA [Candidatus Desulfofervidus auxilii]|uniref:tRNA dimethylallyltransferase n=1 Tax=Desulfofervidus auxilii TaxID=1621989 RepID=A0A7C0Y3F2_DESA2|nr:tRNA (adenosine(37)-N6)-dimethylallyltransferase MiaA [Candidatus Desulfofervidus auxilii]
MKPKIIILTGPTGVGKTALSLSLAQKFNAEIVNADSMQIYRYMDIGTAKPSPEERKIVPHHLIDIKNPDEDYDVAQYRKDADKAIRNIFNKGKNVLVVGGTMLYLKILTHGIFPAPPSDKFLRQQLKNLAEKKGRKYLHDLLKKIDLEAANRIQPSDIIRVIRAIEVYKLTGKPISWHQKQHRFSEKPYDYLKICLYRPREELYQRIEKRVEEMFAQGLVEEVENLLKMGYTAKLKPMQAIGYRHVIAYLQGKYDLEETKRLLKRDTRRYAKRQLSWFRQEKDIEWYSVEEEKRIENAIVRFLEK